MNDALKKLIEAVRSRETRLLAEGLPKAPHLDGARRAVLLRLAELEHYAEAVGLEDEQQAAVEVALRRWMATSALNPSLLFESLDAVIEAAQEATRTATPLSLAVETDTGRRHVDDKPANPPRLPWTALTTYRLTIEGRVSREAWVTWSCEADHGVELLGDEVATNDPNRRKWRSRGPSIGAVVMQGGKTSVLVTATVDDPHVRGGPVTASGQFIADAKPNHLVTKHPVRRANAVRVTVNVIGSALTALPLMHALLDDPPGYMIYFALIALPFGWERIAALTPVTLESAQSLTANVTAWARSRRAPRFTIR